MVIVLGVLLWRGMVWARWPLVVILCVRLVALGRALAATEAPADVVRVGALAVLVVYAGAGLVLASPLVRDVSAGKE